VRLHFFVPHSFNHGSRKLSHLLKLFTIRETKSKSANPILTVFIPKIFEIGFADFYLVSEKVTNYEIRVPNPPKTFP